VTELAALRRFSYPKTFIIGFGFLGISIIWPIFNQFVPIFLQAGNPEFTQQLLAQGRAVPDVAGFGLVAGSVHHDLGQPDQHLRAALGRRA